MALFTDFITVRSRGFAVGDFLSFAGDDVGDEVVFTGGASEAFIEVMFAGSAVFDYI